MWLGTRTPSLLKSYIYLISKGGSPMTISGRYWVAVTLAGLAPLAAIAASHKTAENWIGVWGYVISPRHRGLPRHRLYRPRPRSHPWVRSPLPCHPLPRECFRHRCWRTRGIFRLIPRPPISATRRSGSWYAYLPTGSRLRLRFSNEEGADPLSVAAVHVGLAAADGSWSPERTTLSPSTARPGW